MIIANTSLLFLQISGIYPDIQLIENDDDTDWDSDPISTSVAFSAQATSPIKPRDQHGSTSPNNPRGQPGSRTFEEPRPIKKRVPLATQFPADPHLTFISQFYDNTNPYWYKTYVWQEPGGEGVDLFIIDTGANIDNVDYQKMHLPPVWLWPTGQFWEAHANDPNYADFTDSTGGAGSCTLSLAAGYFYGASKWVQTYIAKVPARNARPIDRTKFQLTYWYEMVSVVYNHIVTLQQVRTFRSRHFIQYKKCSVESNADSKICAGQ